MKKFLVPLLLFAALFAGMALPAAAANANRPGQVKYHNFISYLGWKADSTRVASADTLFLVLDSANSVPFNTATIGRMKSPIETEFARTPDSIGFVLQTFGDISDASSYEFNVQYSLNGKSGPWYTLGTPDTITIADTTKQVNYPKARVLIPDAMVRGTIKTTTATDITRLKEARFTPIFR